MNAGSAFRMLWLISAFLLAACTAHERMVDSTNLTAEGGIEPPVLVHGDPTESRASLINACERQAYKWNLAISSGRIFSVTGRVIKVNGADVQVFEYPSAEAMESDAAQVSADAGSIGTSMVTWIAAPHFFKSDQILLLYVGDDSAVLHPLNAVLGEQFAGR